MALTGMWRTGETKWVTALKGYDLKWYLTAVERFHFVPQLFTFQEHIKSQTEIQTFSGVPESLPLIHFHFEKLTNPLLSLKGKENLITMIFFSFRGHTNRDIILHVLIVKAVRTGWMPRLRRQTSRAENLEIDYCWFPTTYQSVCTANIHRKVMYSFNFNICMFVGLSHVWVDFYWKMKRFVWSTTRGMYLSSCWKKNFGLGQWKKRSQNPSPLALLT